MLLVDLNLLIYATNRDAPLRISTNPRVLPSPLSFEQAAGLVDEWLQQPVSRLVHPTDRHWIVLKDLLEPFGTAGNLTSDAHLAALAIEHGAVLCSTDRDFGRFPRARWKNPLD